MVNFQDNRRTAILRNIFVQLAPPLNISEQIFNLKFHQLSMTLPMEAKV